MTGYVVDRSSDEVRMALKSQHSTILGLHRRFWFIERLRFQQEAFLYLLKGLSWALDSGQPLSLALKTVEAKGFLAILTHDVWYRVSKGSTLSNALENYHGFIPMIVITFVRHGESVGDLRSGLEHGYHYLQRRFALRSQLRSVLRMPVLTLGACMVTGIVLYQQIGQILLPMLLEKNVPLSLWTQSLLWITHQQWVWIGAYTLCGVFGISYLYYCLLPRSQMYLHRQLFQYSTLYATLQYAHAFEMISGLLEANLPFLQALSITQATLPCAYLKSQFSILITVIKEGDDVVKACSLWVHFPHHYRQILKYGQTHGRLPEAFRQLRDVYARSLDKTLTCWIQRIPLICLTLVAGLLIFFVQSIMVPLYEAVEVVSHG